MAGKPTYEQLAQKVKELESQTAKMRRREEKRKRFIKNPQGTLSETEILRGLIPICSSCKRIRNEKGYWNELESYITNHSQAEFTHSICPICAEKLYPEFSK